MKLENCCASDVVDGFQVDAVVSVDDRGQMVLPKEVREKAGIRAGDKLAVVSLKQHGEVCCTILIRAETVAGMVKGILGPLMNDVVK
ncbi:MAG: HgcAB-associated protein [Dehalococcoidia bacterium]